MRYRPYGQEGIIMKFRLSDTLALPNFTINLTDSFTRDMAHVAESTRNGKNSERLIAKAELLSPEGIVMNNVLFYAIAHSKELQIMVTGIVSIVPNNDIIQPLTMQCPKAYFTLHSNSVDDLRHGEYGKIIPTLRQMLIDFYRLAEMDN